MRGHLIAKLNDVPDSGVDRHACDCGWLRPRFVDLRGPDKKTPVKLGEFFLLFACPQCGATWDAHYKETS
jgi:hypothetical protein